MTPPPPIDDSYVPREAANRLYALCDELESARVRLEELLGGICQRPEIAGGLADELERIFYTLRNYTYFVDFQRRELAELCLEMDQL